MRYAFAYAVRLLEIHQIYVVLISKLDVPRIEMGYTAACVYTTIPGDTWICATKATNFLILNF